jgi:hypothetical protein
MDGDTATVGPVNADADQQFEVVEVQKASAKEAASSTNENSELLLSMDENDEEEVLFVESSPYKKTASG